MEWAQRRPSDASTRWSRRSVRCSAALEDADAPPQEGDAGGLREGLPLLDGCATFGCDFATWVGNAGGLKEGLPLLDDCIMFGCIFEMWEGNVEGLREGTPLLNGDGCTMFACVFDT